MILSDDDRPIRIRPRKPRTPRTGGAAWSSAYRLLMHYAHTSRRGRRGAAPAHSTRASGPHSQRCAVRVTYLNSRTRGQWKAHGRYLARESATASKDGRAGFNHDRDSVDVVRELDRWQLAGDQRFWKIILSPEFGDRVDLQRLARDLTGRMAADLGTGLEWIAVAHHNTEHPHVHMVIRGVGSDGRPLHFKREYVQRGIRGIAEDLCTRQLGYRTNLDAAEAERREIGESRFTSLDRALLGEANGGASGTDSLHTTVVMNPAQPALNDLARVHANHLIARLAVLRRMGLAESAGWYTWSIRRDLEEVLRAMQRANDRQKILAAHGVPPSDERLPIELVDVRQLTAVEGRILVHGQDEQSGRSYLMLEGTDAKVHFLYYTSEMEEVRASGGLRTNSFLRLKKVSGSSRPTLTAHDLGDAERLLRDRRFMGETARLLLKRGVIPTEEGWAGWLGRYQAALAGAAAEIGRSRERSAALMRDRDRDKLRGR